MTSDGELGKQAESDNIVYMHNTDVPVSGVLEAAIGIDLSGVVLIGRKKDGELYIASSYAKRSAAIYDIECAKLRILE